MKAIALDIETYGAVEAFHDGQPSPVQTVFHPVRSVLTDRCPRSKLIQIVTLTLCEGDSPSAWSPGPTMVLLWRNHRHQQLLLEWLTWADTVIGWNLRFDLLYLRYASARLRSVLTDRLTLIDGMIFNYSHNEGRPEKALKDVTKVRGTSHRQDEDTLRGGRRFKNDTDPRLHLYGAADPHETILQCTDFARAIEIDYPDTPKLHDSTLQIHSSSLWEAIRLEEAGVPLSRFRLTTLDKTKQAEASSAALALKTLGILIEGEGSVKSQRDTLTRIFNLLHTDPRVPDLIEEPSIYNHPCLEMTKGGQSGLNRKLSCGALNRLLARRVLELLSPRTSDQATALTTLQLWDTYARAANFVSDYTTPLLRQRNIRKGSKGHPEDSRALPSPDAGRGGTGPNLPLPAHAPDPSSRVRFAASLLAWPTWYVVPGFAGGDFGGKGGQIQARFSAARPGITKFSREMEDCYQSRFPGGFIVTCDARQLELATVAVSSGEPALLEPIRRGDDLHALHAIDLGREVGVDVENDPKWKTGDPDDPRQYLGKRPRFEALYWAGWRKMQMACLDDGGPLLPARIWRRLVEARSQLMPVLYSYQVSLLNEAESRGLLVLPITGHSRRFAGFALDQRKAYSSDGKGIGPGDILNFDNQPKGALAVHHVAFRLARTILPPLSTPLPRLLMFCNGYDSLVFDCAPELKDALLTAIPAAFAAEELEGYWSRLTSHYGNPCPFRCEMKVGCRSCGTPNDPSKTTCPFCTRPT